MPKPVLHFAHANGFPAGSYNKVFRLVKDELDVIHVGMFAHDPDYPVRSGWEEQADQLIDFLEANAHEPVIGAGHSFGASVTFMAAVKRPDLFRGIVLMEPILFIGPFKYLISFAKKTGLIDYFSPAGKTKGRRRHWPDLESARAYFRSRSLFKSLDPDCLEDYIKSGLVRCDEGYCLRFSVDQEIAIFRNGPHHFDRYAGMLTDMPGFVYCAEDTNAMPIPVIRKFAGRHGFEFSVVPGGHMFPLEHPEATATLIKECAARIVGRNG